MDNNNLFGQGNMNPDQNAASRGQYQQPYNQGYQGQYQQQYNQGYQGQYQQQYQQPYQSYDNELEEPVSFGEWMLTYLIMCIPCAGIIMMLIWAFGSGAKKSKSNFCKAMLAWMLIILGVYIVFVVAIFMLGVFGVIGSGAGSYYGY